MACGDDVKTQLSRYVDGELSPEERLRVDEHVASCAPCRELLQIFQKNESILSNALSTESFGNAVIESVLNEIKREGPPIEAKPVDESPAEWFRARPMLQLAAAALLVAGLVVVLNASHRRDLETMAARIDSLSAKADSQNQLMSKINEDSNRTIALLRLDQARQRVPEREIILAHLDPHHLIVKASFDLKQFSSFELFRRSEGQGNDAWVKISGGRRLDSPEHIDTDVKPGQAYVYKFRAYRSAKDTEGVESFPHTMRVPKVQEVAADKSIRVECMDIGASFKVARVHLHRKVDGREVTQEFFVKPGDRLGEERDIPGVGKVDFRTNLMLERLEEGNQTLTVYYTRAVLDPSGKPVVKEWRDGVEEVMTEQKEGVLSIRPNMRACFRQAGSDLVDVWKGGNLYVRSLD